MVNHEKIIYELYPALMKYPLIINILLESRDKNGISCITQKNIGTKVGLTQTAISKYLKRLEQYDKCIEMVVPSRYIVNHSDMIKYGPVNRVLLFHNKAMADEDFLSLEFTEQVKQLGISREAVIMAKHHFIQFMIKIDNSEQ